MVGKAYPKSMLRPLNAWTDHLIFIPVADPISMAHFGAGQPLSRVLIPVSSNKPSPLVFDNDTTIIKCALFIATQNVELRDERKDIWHVQTQDENSGELSGRVARSMNCVTV